jgi:hypothetical protein
MRQADGRISYDISQSKLYSYSKVKVERGIFNPVQEYTTERLTCFSKVQFLYFSMPVLWKYLLVKLQLA